MKIITRTLFVCLFFICNVATVTAQVGINTTDPEGALDIVSTDQGVVMPRVSAVENVVTPDGNRAVNGTIVYDLSREQMCMRINDAWVCTDVTGARTIVTDPPDPFTGVSGYIKASNTQAEDRFGTAVSISGDGNYLVIGTPLEDSNDTGINGDQTDNSAGNSGAVYVFVRSGSTWVQQAYLKASNTRSSDFFGESVSLNSDGSYLAVGAGTEDSSATGINGNETNDSASNSGAVYIFIRSGTTWSQQAYIKASNTDSNDSFGESLSISGDGSYLAVGATGEDSNATGINGNEITDTQASSGAVYIFTRSGTTWSQQAYVKSSNSEFSDFFGTSVAISSDGMYLAVSASGEDSNATGVNGVETDNSSGDSGATYIFVRSGTTWSQQAYIKASNTDTGDEFGTNVAISADGSYVLVSALEEQSNATGINGDETNNTIFTAGAVYVYQRVGTTWTQIAYVKASNTASGDGFGNALAIDGDGTRFVVGADFEDSNTTGIDGDQNNNSAVNAGAVYSYLISGTTVTAESYIKASNTGVIYLFGGSIDISDDGTTLLVGSRAEDSNATGVGGDQTNTSANAAGAAYVID